jgi:hypothetical protein
MEGRRKKGGVRSWRDMERRGREGGGEWGEKKVTTA